MIRTPATVMRHFHETSKPTAVLCHGPISLLSASPNSKEVVAALSASDAAGARAKAQGWIYSGYKMTILNRMRREEMRQNRIYRFALGNRKDCETSGINMVAEQTGEELPR
jgi:putative intracellular protease/amidase